MAYMLDVRDGVLIACAIVLSLALTPCALADENTKTSDSEIGNRITNSQTGDNDSELAKTAGYDRNSDNGFFINTKDGSFSLNFGAYTQARYDINWRDNAPTDEDDVEEDF